jgi:hypothetical protein
MVCWCAQTRWTSLPGEITGGFHGDGYVTGSSLGKAGIFGRLAGHAARAHAARDFEPV